MEKVPPIPGESLPKFSINSVQTGTKSYISQIPAISSTTDDHYTVTDNQSNFVSSSEQPLPSATQNLNTAFSDAVQKDNCWTPSIFLPIGINDEVIDIIPFLSSGSKPSNFPRGAVLCIGHFPDSDSMCQFIKEKALTGGTKLLSKKVLILHQNIGTHNTILYVTSIMQLNQIFEIDLPILICRCP